MEANGVAQMNYRQMQYAVMLSETLNFSQVADTLGISQPALSKQIISLENDLGVKLFDRSSSPMKLTPAGEHFIPEARELLFREEQLMKRMQDYSTGERSRLVIGISPFRSLYFLSDVLLELRHRHPGLQIALEEAGSDVLHKEAAEGRYDFAIVNLPVDETLLNVIPLQPEPIVLAAPRVMSAELPISPDPAGGPHPMIDLADCARLPFITLKRGQIMRRLFDRLCTTAGLRPEICAEVVGVTTTWAMVRAGLGATILPLQFISSHGFDGGINVFRLKQADATRQPVIVTGKNQYISPQAQEAIALLRQSR